MPEYIISNCTVADGADMARNNMTAFWQDPNWRYVWKTVTLPYVIEQCTARAPRNLLSNRALLRHYKAVDPETGKFLGYIRWKLHPKHYQDEKGNPAWADGQTPDVTPEERAQIEKTADAAWWEPGSPDDNLDDILRVIKGKILAEKYYVELDYFAVHPENQGHGVGRALLEHGVRKAQELGADIFVMAFVGGFELYRRLGFKLLDTVIQDARPFGGTENYTVQFMELEASKGH